MKNAEDKGSERCVMIKIREYFKNRKNVSDDEMDDMQEKINKHRRIVKIRMAGILIAVLAVALLVVMYISNRTFESYEIDSVIETDNSQEGDYFSFYEGMLVYSDDGVSYLKNGKYIWNQAFEMKEPRIDVCENMMAIADLNTTTVYIYNDEGKQGEIETVYPIIDLEVSAQGVIAALTQDADTNRIEIFDKTGTSIAVGQTYISGEGCPIDITLSNDGTKLAASYVYIDGGLAKCKVVFYNYSEVGKNEVSRIVGGFNCDDESLIGKIVFIDNDTVVAYGNRIVSLYSIKEKPEIVSEIEIKDDICSVFYNEEYIGLVQKTAEYDNPYKLTVYDKEGIMVVEKYFDIDYDEVVITDDSIIVYNEKEMILMNLSGRERYRGEIKEGIKKLVPKDSVNKIYIINADFDIMNVILN